MTAPAQTVEADGESFWSKIRFLATPRWISLIIAAIAFALACYFLLAPWQFNRNHEQSAQNRAIAAAAATPPVPIGELMSTEHGPASTLQYREVSATGHFDAAGQAYIRLRTDNRGDPANEVVVPFVTTAGPRVLVDRGYWPLTAVLAGTPLPALPEGTVTITARVTTDEADPYHRPPVTAPDGLPQYLVTNWRLAGATNVYHGYVELVPGSPAVMSPIGMPNQEVGPFFSYAVQWMSFGAIAIFGLGYFIYREFTDPVEGDIYLPDEDDAGAGGDGSGAPPADGERAEPLVAVAASGAAPPAAAVRTPRRPRRRFDKSQLYDTD